MQSLRALGRLYLVTGNYPKAMYFTQVAASMGIEGSMLKVLQMFRDGDYGYKKDAKLADKYDRLLTMLENDESLTFPDLVERHPLPPHPTMGLYNPETDQNELPE